VTFGEEYTATSTGRSPSTGGGHGHGYGVLYPAGYSLLAPYLLAVSGTRTSMAAATVLCASFVLRAS
jgi:hypothetical protein